MDHVMPVYLAAVASAGPETPGMLELVLDADIVVQLVLFVLVAMSIGCWVVIFAKFGTIRRARNESAEFLEIFWGSKRLDEVYNQTDRFPGSPIAEVFKSGYVELHKLTRQGTGSEADTGLSDNLARSLRRAATVELTNLERLVPFLATTGSTAPFIGLFGTVWGILRAFQKIGATGQATLAVVGPDIAHALIATAVGLAAAIPAVMAYNYFHTQLKVLGNEMDAFSADFQNIVKRHYRKA